MSNPLVKNYKGYHEMLLDLANLSDDFDIHATISKAPPMCFYTKDGLISLGGNLTNFMQKVRDVLGVKVNPMACQEFTGYFIISYEDYSPVEKEKEVETLKVKPVDSPAKKRSSRASAK